MARETVDVCLRVLKESKKSRLGSHSVRNSVLIIAYITFRDCRVNIHSVNLFEIAVKNGRKPTCTLTLINLCVSRCPQQERNFKTRDCAKRYERVIAKIAPVTPWIPRSFFEMDWELVVSCKSRALHRSLLSS